MTKNKITKRSELKIPQESALSEKQKREIEKSVKRTIKEYGETLRLLGKE
ncbi:MAG: hypothetical protein UV39_C0033G0005 [Candidatus Azambacteria bacterium GW2011_GWA2_42_62]|nr:MAG: hypothetical protein UV39_C0033G0005 [Candidatus Azambacteria bacterium GW2011_GWA2_42_62]KKS73888.1 MAG: hypothetical protein UV45_C0019G0006 [Candidatus Azambacteria bacterium GW2011_GWB1_42_72]KKT03360.1 MAG: hypothetical protein UV81_C0002G0113 [Candidatus Azambacteria bacterium GW2011_GWD1_43_18]KKT12286.1 MAG: hypothetical protein UV93_C0005G0041 [Candidatus Azambacteria bacterium GW2011_GWC2_43_27]